jgi:hypothetical protein
MARRSAKSPHPTCLYIFTSRMQISRLASPERETSWNLRRRAKIKNYASTFVNAFFFCIKENEREMTGQGTLVIQPLRISLKNSPPLRVKSGPVCVCVSTSLFRTPENTHGLARGDIFFLIHRARAAGLITFLLTACK